MGSNWEESPPDTDYHLPYRWQLFNGTNWEDLPNMEDIERAYSEPGKDNYQSINFQTMTAGDQKVRRLCNLASVLTTEWIWYWKDECGIWIEYGQPNAVNERASRQSSYLEVVYRQDDTATYPFTVGTKNYILNFREMKQKNTSFNTEREVRRRPKFLNGDNAKVVKRSMDSAVGNSNKIQNPWFFSLQTRTYPTHWDVENVPKSEYRKMNVLKGSSEFSNLTAMFFKTVQGYVVKTAWRVQNLHLWQLYQLQKDQMTNRNLDMNKSELQLFHGTDGAHVNAICRESFDWRICGSHGTVFGQGSYFARDASYSHIYASPSPTGVQTMFVARVLLGDFIEGDSKMRRPPQKMNSSQRYDSCVDNVDNPSIFVVFERFQAYPEYILEYEEDCLNETIT